MKSILKLTVHVITALIRHRRERLSWVRIRARSLTEATRRARNWLPRESTILDAFKAAS